MGEPPLENVAYSSRRFVPFQLKQNTFSLSFRDTRESLLQKVGEPLKTSMPDGVLSSVFGRVYWDAWHVEGLAVHATYDPETWTPRLLSISLK